MHCIFCNKVYIVDIDTSLLRIKINHTHSKVLLPTTKDEKILDVKLGLIHNYVVNWSEV